MRFPHKVFRTLAAFGAIAALAGCTAVVSGSPAPGEIDVRTLDTGAYPTQAWDAHDDSYTPSFSQYYQIAAMRLADHIATGFDIDPTLKYGLKHSFSSFTSGALPSALTLGEEAVEGIVERNRMLFGYESIGGDRPDDFLTSWEWPKTYRTGSTIIATFVMQFPDAAAAGTAGAELAAADRAHFPDTEPVILTEYPGAQSLSQPGSKVIRSFLAHGSYVVALTAAARTSDRNAVTDLAQRAYRTQLPMLDELPPLSDEQMLDLPWDPDRLMHRTLNPDAYAWPDADERAVFSPQGYLHTAYDRETAKATVTALGADRISVVDDTVLVRAADATKAKNAVTQRLTPMARKGDAASPANVPDSACVENLGYDKNRTVPTYTCVVAYRRYVAYVNADQLLDAQQRAAAQYAILANG